MNHTPGFVEAASSEDAFRWALDCAKGLAAVGFDVLARSANFHSQAMAHFGTAVMVKAAAVAREFGKPPLDDEWASEVIEHPPEKLKPLLEVTPGITLDEVPGAMMALDAFHLH